MFIPKEIQLTRNNILYLLNTTKEIFLPNLVADLILRTEEYELISNFIISNKFIINSLIEKITFNEYVRFIIHTPLSIRDQLIELSMEISNYDVQLYRYFWNNFKETRLKYFSKKEFLNKYFKHVNEYDKKVLKNAVVSLEDQECLTYFRPIILILCNIKFSSDFIAHFLELLFKYNFNIQVQYDLFKNIYYVINLLNRQPRLKIFLGFAMLNKLDLNRLWNLTYMDDYNNLFELYRIAYQYNNYKNIFDIIRVKKDKNYEYLFRYCHFMKHDSLIDLVNFTKFT